MSVGGRLTDDCTFLSPYGHAETVRRLEQEIGSRGATIYGRVDHAANAVSAGLRTPRRSHRCT
jgi:uncharacterized protein (DUF302 family)